MTSIERGSTPIDILADDYNSDISKRLQYFEGKPMTHPLYKPGRDFMPFGFRRNPQTREFAVRAETNPPISTIQYQTYKNISAGAKAVFESVNEGMPNSANLLIAQESGDTCWLAYTMFGGLDQTGRPIANSFYLGLPKDRLLPFRDDLRTNPSLIGKMVEHSAIGREFNQHIVKLPTNNLLLLGLPQREEWEDYCMSADNWRVKRPQDVIINRLFASGFSTDIDINNPQDDTFYNSGESLTDLAFKIGSKEKDHWSQFYLNDVYPEPMPLSNLYNINMKVSKYGSKDQLRIGSIVLAA